MYLTFRDFFPAFFVFDELKGALGFGVKDRSPDVSVN